jgi:hypothetical protein
VHARVHEERDHLTEHTQIRRLILPERGDQRA